MIRAGEGGYLADQFAKGYVAIGWSELGDLTQYKTQDAIEEKFLETYPEEKKGAIANKVAMIYKFRHVVKNGDTVLTYDSLKREYKIGKILSDYFFDPKTVPPYSHIRKVAWEKTISRDNLKLASRNTLGSNFDTLRC